MKIPILEGMGIFILQGFFKKVVKKILFESGKNNEQNFLKIFKDTILKCYEIYLHILYKEIHFLNFIFEKNMQQIILNDYKKMLFLMFI